MARKKGTSRADLYDLLSRWSLSPAEPSSNEAISRMLWDACGATRAVLVSDLSGFTRITKARGILQFLAIHERTVRIGETVFERHGGRFLKTPADNLFALFDTAGAAAACARAMLREAAKHNAQVPDLDGHIHLCFGIAHGAILELTDDAFGDAVNVAFKLGEDIAEAGQILLDEGAADDLRKSLTHKDLAAALTGPREIDAGGVTLRHYLLPPG